MNLLHPFVEFPYAFVWGMSFFLDAFLFCAGQLVAASCGHFVQDMFGSIIVQRLINCCEVSQIEGIVEYVISNCDDMARRIRGSFCVESVVRVWRGVSLGRRFPPGKVRDNDEWDVFNKWVQRIVERLCHPRGGILDLCMDERGMYTIQEYLFHVGSASKEWKTFFEAIVYCKDFVKIALDERGHRVVEKLLRYGSKREKEEIMWKIKEKVDRDDIRKQKLHYLLDFW